MVDTPGHCRAVSAHRDESAVGRRAIDDAPVVSGGQVSRTNTFSPEVAHNDEGALVSRLVSDSSAAGCRATKARRRWRR